MSLFAKPDAVAARERQVADLLEAVYEAQQLAIALCKSPDSAQEVKQLFSRLETVRLEVEQLHLGSGPIPFEEIDPKWTGLVPWRTVSDL